MPVALLRVCSFATNRARSVVMVACHQLNCLSTGAVSVQCQTDVGCLVGSGLHHQDQSWGKATLTVSFLLCLAVSLAPYRSHSGPKKSRKEVPGASRPGVKEGRKKSKKVKNESKTTFFRLFQPFFDFFSTFFDPAAERPREPFFDFFGISGPKGPNDSCKGPRRSQLLPRK